MFLSRICKRISCQKEFKTEDKRQQYCCINCAYQDRSSNKVQKVCEYCGKTIYIFPSRDDGRHHFCNEVCQIEWQKIGREVIKWDKPLPWVKRRPAKVCEYCRKTYRPSHAHSKFCSNDCHLNNLFDTQQKENHPAWKGGVTEGRRKLELESHYKAWKKSVYKRDKFRCAVCGSAKNICAHHIKTFADYPELRAEISNGITLCQVHHLMTYGKEPLFEDYFYKIMSLLDSISTKSVRLAAVS